MLPGKCRPFCRTGSWHTDGLHFILIYDLITALFKNTVRTRKRLGSYLIKLINSGIVCVSSRLMKSIHGSPQNYFSNNEKNNSGCTAQFSDMLTCSILVLLAYWGRDSMGDIVQTTFWNFTDVVLRIWRTMSRSGSNGASELTRQHPITWSNKAPIHFRVHLYASLGLDVLK